MTTATTTVADDLQTIVTLWPHLDDMLDTHHSTPWPPAGRMSDYLRALEQADAEGVRQAHEPEVPSGQPPIRLAVFDTARAVERVLLDLADQIASSVQRPAATARSAGPGDEVGQRLSLTAAQDQADPSRWSWTDPRTRSAVHACIWLGHRLDSAPGPFWPLTTVQRDRIAMVARGAVQRLETALDLTRQSTRPGHTCPHCRTPVAVHGGDGQPPTVRCDACGWARTAEVAA